jgi:hypothetical protein
MMTVQARTAGQMTYKAWDHNDSEIVHLARVDYDLLIPREEFHRGKRKYYLYS